MATNSYATPSNSNDQWYSFLKTLSEGGGDLYSNYNSKLPWWSRDYYEKDPSAGYGLYSAFEGEGESNPYKSWLNKQFGNYYDQYMSQASLDPTLFWTDYMKGLNPKGEYNKQSPYERGIVPYAFSPTMRMVW